MAEYRTYAAQLDQGCIPYSTGIAEVPGNGIDDDCDGVFPGEDICNGIDDDNNGRTDDLVGSCAERHLFIPYCWNGGDRTLEEQQSDFDTAVKRWEDYYAMKSGIAFCDERLPIYYETAAINLFNIADCTNPPAPSEFIASIKANNLYDLRDWDVVSLVTNPASVDVIGGSTPGGGIIKLFTGGAEPLFNGEYGTFAHEYGHLLGLREEYRIDTASPNPNPLDAVLGCDQGTLTKERPTTTAEFAQLGNCCYPFPRGCSTDPSSLDYCVTADGLGYGYRCLGNMALDLDYWNEGETPGLYPDPDPAVYGDEGRCIMSAAERPGWDKGNTVTGSGSERGWCSHCWEVIRQQAPNCSSYYLGDRRRLQIAGRVDANGNIVVDSASVESGRVGHTGTTNAQLIIEVSDTRGVLLGTLSPQNSFATTENGQYDYPDLASSFWSRIAVADDVDLPLRLASVLDGVVVSTVTPGGAAPVAELVDVTAECSQVGGGTVTLDASESFDSDGDSTYFDWTIAESMVSTGRTPTLASHFSLGTTPVAVTVFDGTFASAVAEATVTILDTVPPTIRTTPIPTVLACDGATKNVTIPAASAYDSCSGAVQVAGAIVSSTNPRVSLPLSVSGGTVELPIGKHTLRWTATDPSGNVATAEQDVVVAPGFLALQSLDVRDRVTVATDGGYAMAASLGSTTTSVGVDTTLGAVMSQASIDFRDRAHVQGDVLTAGTITRGNDVSIAGAILENTESGLRAPEVDFPTVSAANGDVYVEPDGSLTIDEGSYGTIHVYSRATLYLQNGTYFAQSLVLEPQATLVVLDSAGMTVLDELVWRGEVTTSHPLPLTYWGTDPVVIESPISAALVAPDAEVILRSEFVGSLMAKGIVIDAGESPYCMQ